MIKLYFHNAIFENEGQRASNEEMEKNTIHYNSTFKHNEKECIDFELGIF